MTLLVVWTLPTACGARGEASDEDCDGPLSELCTDCPTEEEAAAQCAHGEIDLREVPCDVATVRRCRGRVPGLSRLFAWDAGGSVIAGGSASCDEYDGQRVGPGCDESGGWTVFGDPPAELRACITRAPVDLDCIE